jgi:hypothetical protein
MIAAGTESAAAVAPSLISAPTPRPSSVDFNSVL